MDSLIKLAKRYGSSLIKLAEKYKYSLIKLAKHLEVRPEKCNFAAIIRTEKCVEVWNEGSLPKELTPEALLRHHSSHPRNKNIAYAFFKAGFIESWGRGYKKIREGFEKAGLPMPKIEDVEGGVRVTFQRNNVSNSSKDELIKNISNENKRELSDVLKNVLKNVQKKDLEKLTERQIDVLEFIVQTPTITFKEMSKRLKVSVKTIQRDFTAMGLLGINIVRKDGKTYGEWVIK